MIATLSGLWRAVYAPLGFLFPLVVILPIVFPRMVRPAWEALRRSVSPRSWDRDNPDWLLLLLHMTLGGFLFLILGALLTGASHYLERYMHPFFLLTPLWLLAMVERSGRAERKILVLAAVLLAVTAVALPFRVAKLVKGMVPQCEQCRTAIPYDGLAAALKARGIWSGTIIASNRVDAGNLRRLFPEARIVCLKHPNYGPVTRTIDLSSPSAVVWRPSEGASLPRGAEQELSGVGGVGVIASQELRIPWTPLGAKSATRDWPWMIAVAAPQGS